MRLFSEQLTVAPRNKSCDLGLRLYVGKRAHAEQLVGVYGQIGRFHHRRQFAGAVSKL